VNSSSLKTIPLQEFYAQFEELRSVHLVTEPRGARHWAPNKRRNISKTDVKMGRKRASHGGKEKTKLIENSELELQGLTPERTCHRLRGSMDKSGPGSPDKTTEQTERKTQRQDLLVEFTSSSLHCLPGKSCDFPGMVTFWSESPGFLCVALAVLELYRLIDKAGLELTQRDPPSSASRVLELKICDSLVSLGPDDMEDAVQESSSYF
ncbi:hypothetical protein STEG23_024594, partial [Scotinomys teguina]